MACLLALALAKPQQMPAVFSFRHPRAEANPTPYPSLPSAHRRRALRPSFVRLSPAAPSGDKLARLPGVALVLTVDPVLALTAVLVSRNDRLKNKNQGRAEQGRESPGPDGGPQAQRAPRDGADLQVGDGAGPRTLMACLSCPHGGLSACLLLRVVPHKRPQNRRIYTPCLLFSLAYLLLARKCVLFWIAYY